MKNRKSEKSAVLLFPRNALCAQLATRFAEEEFSVSVVLFEEQGRSFFEGFNENISVQRFSPPADRYWENMSEEAKSRLLSAQVFVFCADKDFLHLKVSGQQEEWHIDAQNDVQQRFAFIDRLLSLAKPGGPQFWANVAVGTRAPDQMEASYCKTRYGMLGFSKAIELNARFKGIVVQNICLSFFRFYQRHPEADYCTNCTTAQERETLTQLSSEEELIDYLVQKSEKILKAK